MIIVQANLLDNSDIEPHIEITDPENTAEDGVMPQATLLNGGKPDSFPAIEGIDRDTAMAVFGSNRVLFTQLLENFLVEYEYLPEKLRQALEQSETGEINAVLHRLRGNTLNLAANRLSDTAKLLEESIESHNGLEYVLLESFEREFLTLKSSFSAAKKLSQP